MDINELSTEIERMSDEDVFDLMAALEQASNADGNRTDTDIAARIALVETEIDSRFPGQLLAPFKHWKLTGDSSVALFQRCFVNTKFGKETL